MYTRRHAEQLWRDFQALSKRFNLSTAEQAALLGWSEPLARQANRGALPERDEYIDRLKACLAG